MTLREEHILFRIIESIVWCGHYANFTTTGIVEVGETNIVEI
jgi:hypothetical protein